MSSIDKKKRILIVSCDNGLGHVKRSIILGDKLASENYTVDIVCSSFKFIKICKILRITNILNNVDIKIYYMKENEDFENRKKIFKTIPFIHDYDFVISDNLIELLIVRPDTIILANFWWHDVLNFKKKMTDKFKNILQLYNPLIIGSEIFATLNVKKNTNFKPIGILTKNIYKLEKDQNVNNLLISVGASGVSLDEYKSFFIKNFNFLKNKFDNIYCDPVLINKINLDGKMIKANYSEAMYSKINVAIIRPGLGTISDLLSHRCIPICLYENNSEMVNNALVIESKKVGLNLGIISKKNEGLQDLLNQLAIKKQHLEKNILSLNMNGLIEAANIIKHKIDNN